MKSLPPLLLVVTAVYAQEYVSEDIYDLCSKYFDREYTFPANFENSRKRYERYLQRSKKSYKDPQEKECRLRIFAANLGNMEKMRGKHRRARFGENKFADWTKAEIQNLFRGLKDIEIPQAPIVKRSATPAPSSVNWVTAGKVNAVKDQGNCGSCWAFATTAVVEAAHKIKKNLNVSLSEQQLVNCDRPSNGGCNGGHYYNALNYITKNGISRENSFPYKAVDSKQCPVINDQKIFINGRKQLPQDVEVQKQWIAENGPVAAAMTPIPIAFMYLLDTPEQRAVAGEVFIPAGNCTQEIMHGGHAVTIVGYGRENGTDYWLIKNSWGRNWGNDGYYKFIRGINACGIEKQMMGAVLN